MNTLEEILKESFKFDEETNYGLDLALVSLQVALKAYFSTYQTFKGRMFVFEKEDDSNVLKDVPSNYLLEYCEAYAECIVHFQHFSELVIKNFLRQDHSLLADLSDNKVEVFHKLLHGNPLNDEDSLSLKSVEFSEALSRILRLVKSTQIKNYEELKFILNHKSTLEELNKLRNRIWHRGLHILKYNALDSFVGGYILPFVKDVLEHPLYKGNAYFYIYKSLFCEVDPISEVIQESKKEYPNIKKLAFLKELGRASFINPLTPVRKTSGVFKSIEEILNNDHKARAARIAKIEQKYKISEIDTCPVCGVDSLNLYQDTDTIYDVDDNVQHYLYPMYVKCQNCTFNVEPELSNASIYDLKSIKDFF